MTLESVPKNCLFVPGSCEAHQGHRMVELREKPIIGDIHAIAFSASNPVLQNKLQTVLKKILEGMIFIRGHGVELPRRVDVDNSCIPIGTWEILPSSGYQRFCKSP